MIDGERIPIAATGGCDREPTEVLKDQRHRVWSGASTDPTAIRDDSTISEHLLRV
ncbi:hypothetical protein [Rhodoplanes roseus]|uniref:hypothetical protein n=1 Tax=Rhodoplanes roseus TaxID=29409 RepID=UPI0014730608|nr:hypothetical protein [Rhodoplanes roseus]